MIFGWLGRLFQGNNGNGGSTSLFDMGGDSSVFSDDQGGDDGACSVNPASGLPMIGGCGGVDVEGNPYGTDFSDDSFSSSGMNDDWSSGSGWDD
ncbi:MAG: hypothetical protein ACYCR3_06595 [Acidithiobacillus sp.]